MFSCECTESAEIVSFSVKTKTANLTVELDEKSAG